MITAVYTKWGWVSQKAMYLIQEGYDDAIEKRLDTFRIGENVFVTQFAGYLLAFLKDEGLVPVKPDGDVQIFQPAEGTA